MSARRYRALTVTLLALLTSVAAISPIAVAGPAEVAAFDALQRGVSAVRGRTPAAGAEWTQVSLRIRDLAEELQTRIGSRELSPAYAASVSANATILLDAAKGAAAGPSLDQLQIVAADLGAKLSTLQSSFGLQASTGGDIEVAVTTTRNDSPISGFLIRMNLAGYADSPSPFAIFNQRSSPTKARVPPGRYVLLVRDSDDTSPIVRQLVTVVGSSSKTLELTVQVP